MRKQLEKMIDFCKSKRELVTYGIFGLLTTAVNVIVYQLLILVVDYRISNLIALVFAKVFAYVVNKIFVFHSRCKNIFELLGEMVRFILARGFTGIIDYFGLILMVECFCINELYAKYILQIIVIILNYVFGKKAVFITGKKDFPNGNCSTKT